MIRTPRETPTDRPLLPHIPPQLRGPVMNDFLLPVRDGMTDPHQIVREAVASLQRRLRSRGRFAQAVNLDPLRQAIMAIMGHPSEALDLAREAIAWEELPAEEKVRIKAERGERATRTYRHGNPPTPKQLAYLRALGYGGPPVTTQQQASEAIDALLRQRKGGRDG